MADTGKLQITTPSEREIAMTRVFDAPRGLVFDAWTRPELLKRWLGVRGGWTFAVCEVDLRVGGAYRFVWRGPNGKEMGMGALYREIVRPERLVATEKFATPGTRGALDTTVGRQGGKDDRHDHGALRGEGGPRRGPKDPHGDRKVESYDKGTRCGLVTARGVK